MALMEETFQKTFSEQGPKANVTKLFEIVESPSNAVPTTTSSVPLKLLRGIHISELYGTTINPEPLHPLDRSEAPRRKARDAEAFKFKSEWTVSKDVTVSEHLTEGLLQRLTGCTNFNEIRSLELKIDTSESSNGNFGNFLPELSKLRLSDSTISCVREIGTGFGVLRVLWLSRCGLEELDGISAMHCLRELYLPYNEISDLSPCGMLDELEILDLEGNSVDDLGQVDFLALSSSLTHLTLEGNPVCVMPSPDAQDSNYDYRSSIALSVPHLKCLDDIPLSASPSRKQVELSRALEPPPPKAASTTISTVPRPRAKSDFADDWALINEFLGCGSGGSASSGNTQEDLDLPDPFGIDTTKQMKKGPPFTKAPLTVKDICSDPQKLYRSTSQDVDVTSKISAPEEAPPKFPAPTEVPSKLPAAGQAPPVRVTTAVVRSRSVTSMQRPVTSSGRRPMTGRPGTTRPPTASTTEEEVSNDPTFSELTYGGIVCGSISRSLTTRRKKKNLPDFIDLNPESPSESCGSGVACAASEDSLDLDPLTIRQVDADAKDGDSEDDDFAIHVVDSACRSAHRSGAVHLAQLESNEASCVDSSSSAASLYSTCASSSSRGDVVPKLLSPRQDVVPKLFHSPTPPSSGQKSSRSSRRAHGILRSSADSLPSPTLPSPTLPPLDLKKSI